MTARLRSALRLIRQERGITLVEIIIAMMILSIVSLVFTTTLTSVQKAVVAEEVRSRTNGQARLALQSLDRQVRSGNLLYNPSAETDPYTVGVTGYMLRVYTQADQPALGARCMLWLIDDEQQLKVRSWPIFAVEDATAWRVVAEGIVNREMGSPAFSLDSTGRTASVELHVNADYANQTTATQAVSASLTGRNTSFGYPANVCEDLPLPLT